MKRKYKGKKNKKLYFTIIKGYIVFSLTALLILSIVLLYFALNMRSSIKRGEYPCINAQQIIRADYKNIGVADIVALNGWIEIVDETGKVIYTKGDVKEKKQTYTQKELINLLGWLDYTHSEIEKIRYMGTDNSFLSPNEYYYSSTYFKATNNREYLCLVKIPRSQVELQITFKNVPYRFIEPFYNVVFRSLVLFFILFIVNVLLFGKWMSGKIRKPLNVIMQGLRKLTSGDFSTKINVIAESEFSQIGDAFNYMTEQIEKGIREREQAERVKHEVLVSISHDIKTPITTIQGYSKAILDGIVESGQKQELYLNSIYKKSIKVTDLVDILFDYVRLESGQYVPNLQKHDITETIREVIAFCYDEIENSGIVLELQIPEKEVFCVFDKKEIERVIFNLISNAIKYNDKGTRLKISLNLDEERVNIEFADDGIGIPEELGDSIFNPFVRGDKARKSDGGTGLGLAIAKKIIEKHGGKLKLHRNIGNYKTIFSINLDIGC